MHAQLKVDARRLEVGTQVRVRDAYLDEARTAPVTGEVEDMLFYDGMTRYVVLFNHGNPRLPPGGEFTADALEVEA